MNKMVNCILFVIQLNENMIKMVVSKSDLILKCTIKWFVAPLNAAETVIMQLSLPLCH